MQKKRKEERNGLTLTGLLMVKELKDDSNLSTQEL
jgi:hypothetical protein